MHCPLLSNEVIKLWKNRILIVDAKPYIYILNAKKLLFILRRINHSDTKITINGIDLHVDILKKYISINIEELIALVPELCIDRLEIFEKCLKTLKKKTMNGSHYYPLCNDNLIWPTFKLFISKCPSYVFAVSLNDRTYTTIYRNKDGFSFYWPLRKQRLRNVLQVFRFEPKMIRAIFMVSLVENRLLLWE